MSFWSDASSATKGIIVAGVLLIVLGALYYFWPEPDRAQQRGVNTSEGAAQVE